MSLPKPFEWEAADGFSYGRTLKFAGTPGGSRERGSHNLSSPDPGQGSGATTTAPRGLERKRSKPVFCVMRAACEGAERSREGKGRFPRCGEADAGADSRGSSLVLVLSFEPTISVTNLLAVPAAVRLACPALGTGVYILFCYLLLQYCSRKTDASVCLYAVVVRSAVVMSLQL